MTTPSWLRAVAAEIPAAARTGAIITGLILGLFLGVYIGLEVLS